MCCRSMISVDMHEPDCVLQNSTSLDGQAFDPVAVIICCIEDDQHTVSFALSGSRGL